MSILEPNHAHRERRILAMTSAYHLDDEALIQAWVEYGEQRPVSRGNAIRQLLAAAKFAVPATKPPQPILLLSGLQDQLVNPACSRSLAQLWNVPHHQHPKAGHDIALDVPGWLCQQIEQHVRSFMGQPREPTV